MSVPAADASDIAATIAQRHTPVLLERCLDLLALAIDRCPAGKTPILIDCTLGMGGHTQAALQRFPNLRVVGIDRDAQAIALAKTRLEPFKARFQAVHTTFDQLATVVREETGEPVVDGILMDLGVSSLQLDEAERGFSYARPADLDMRMDQSSAGSAQELLDTATAAQLTQILSRYGQERFAARIAQEIVRRRESGHRVTTTEELSALVRAAIPAPARRTGGNPAKRTFQALRIAVNGELDLLRSALPQALNCLRVGGVLVVESYQSLEDRLVKQVFTAGSTNRVPDALPFVPESASAYLRLLTHGAERADAAELARNPRSASVRLRAAMRTRSAAQAPAAALQSSAAHSSRTSRKSGRKFA